jgi:biopolymer transport protein ExbD
MGGALDESSSSSGRGMISAINVTPLVDVVLVLLIILMVSSTYIVAQTLKVQLPKTKTTDGTAEKPRTVVIEKSGTLRFEEKVATAEEIERELRAMIAANPEASLVISADKEVQHGRVVEIIDLAKLAGVTQFAINVEVEKR